MKLDPIPNAPAWLKKDPKTGVYYVSKYRSDLTTPRLERRIRSETGLDDKLTVKQAQRLGEKMIADWISGSLPRRRKRVTLAFAIDQLLEYRQKRFEAGKIRLRTIKHDKAWLPLIKEWFGSNDPRDIDEAYWETWHEETGSLMQRTHADTAKYLSMTLSYCFKQKWTDRKPAIKNLDGTEYKGRIYTEEEIQALYEAADPKLREQILFGYEAGMRTHEVRELQWQFVLIEPDRVILQLPDWFCKTGGRREFQLSEATAQIIRQKDSEKRSKTGVLEPYIWPSPDIPGRPESDSSFYSRFRSALEKSKIQGRARFYDLRHTFFNRLVYEQGASLQLVSEYGGNSPDTLRANYLRRSAKNTANLVGKVSIGLKRDCGKVSETNPDDASSD